VITPTRVLPYGPRALLAEYETLDDVMAVAAALRVDRPDGVVEIVPAARTVLVVWDGDVRDEEVFTAERSRVHASPVERTVRVRYDGADLADVAHACGLTVHEVVALHSGATYTAAFCGFMPGFAYLVGLPDALHLPRRSTPRTRVPTGSVAIASEYSAVYPSESPGGWHLLGTTDAVMWDEARREPALIPPGAVVRFEPA
jgi:5-oxoprolinase (ATP-hydrolysing) subunit B